jgi:AcrR family transcriptional regulator
MDKGLKVSRTRSPDYDNIQAFILEKTAFLFATRGYAASSIGDIAEACGCSKSRLYHYFSSKEAILSTMLSDHVDGLLEKGRRTLGKHHDPVESFHELIRFFMEVYAVSRDKHVVLLTCMEFLPKKKRQEVVTKQRELISFVRDILKQIRPDRANDASALHVDTMLFFGMINWTYTWYRADGRMTSSELAERCVDIFLDGYRHAGTVSRDETKLPSGGGSGKKRPQVKVAVG